MSVGSVCGPVSESDDRGVHMFTGHVEAVRELVKHGVDVNARHPRGWTALDLACAGGHCTMARELLALGANINGAAGGSGAVTPLLRVLVVRNRSLAKELLEHKADPNLGRWRGLTPLMTAIQKGLSFGLIQKLIAHGAAVAAVDDSEKRCALHFAAGRTRVDVMHVLLEAGANIDACDSGGFTALHVAVKKNRSGAVDFLLNRGADMHMVGHLARRTALQMATNLGHQSIVELLLEHEARARMAGGPDGPHELATH